MQLCLGPCPVEVPGTIHGADHIITTLNNYTGNVTNLRDVLNQIILGGEETVVHEIVTFDPRKRFSKRRVGESFDRFRIKEELRGTSFPNRPGASGRNPHLLIVAGEAAIVSADHVVTFIWGDDFQIFFPDIGKNPATSFLIEPLNLLRPAEKDSPQHELRRALRMR